MDHLNNPLFDLFSELIQTHADLLSTAREERRIAERTREMSLPAHEAGTAIAEGFEESAP